MADAHSDDMRKFIKFIPEYGRWDDLYIFEGTPLEDDAFNLMKDQFNKDINAMTKNSTNISLLGKWLKSINASSNETKKLGRLTAKKFGLSERTIENNY